MRTTGTRPRQQGAGGVRSSDAPMTAPLLHPPQSRRHDAPAEPAVLIPEARRRQRRRWAVITLALCVVALLTGLVASSGPTSSWGRATSAPGGAPWAAPASSSARRPLVAVIHLATATGGPGAIQVVSTRSRLVLRTLGTSYAQQGTGFQITAAEKTLYYERLDPTGPHDQIVAQPLSGGPPRPVALGSSFSLSPTGKLLAVTAWTSAAGGAPPVSPTVRLVDPATSKVVASTRLPVHGGVGTMAWVAGEAELLVLAGAPMEEYLLDVHEDRARVSRVRASTSLPLGPIGWTTVWLLGPGPTAGTVVATSTAGPLATLVVRAADGAVLRHHAVPWPPGDRGVSVRGVDASGRHFLVATTGPTPTRRLWEWTPPSEGLSLVGPADIEATW